MTQPYWLTKAYLYLGVKEISGSKHAQKIITWWQLIRSAFRDDETPWCAAFVGGVLEECGIRSSRSAAARSYNKWGVELEGPAYGCIVTFWRVSPKSASGHVGFVVGRDKQGNLMVLGGNQGDQVSVKAFALSRVLSYRWPQSIALPYSDGLLTLPLIESSGGLSTNEA